MQVITQGIVLKSISFTESSVISTIFTKNMGKISVLARGVKKTKTKFSGLFQPLQHLEIVFTDKAGREIHPVTDATFASKWFQLAENVEKMYLGLVVLEIIDQVTHQHDPNQELYEFSRVFLEWLNKFEHETWMLLPYVLMKICAHLGVGLQLENSESRNLQIKLEDGHFVSSDEYTGSHALSPLQSEYVIIALTRGTANLLNLPISKREVHELSLLLDRYMKFHIEGVKNRKSDRIFNDILNL